MLGAMTLVMAGAAYGQHVSDSDSACRAANDEHVIMACFAGAVTAANRRLNETYAQIIKRLPPEDQASLRSAERLWVQFRDATCKAEGDLYSASNTAPIAFEACVEVETRARSSDLVRIYGARLGGWQPESGVSSAAAKSQP